MAVSRTEPDDSEGEREGDSQLRDQAAALASEVRELRRGYEDLVARIDESLAASQNGEADAANARAFDEPAARERVLTQGEEVSGREMVLLNLAASGLNREEAATFMVESFGEGDDELIDDGELFDKVFGSGPRVAPPLTPPRRFRFRRP